MQQTVAMMERSFLMIDLNDLSCSHCAVSPDQDLQCMEAEWCVEGDVDVCYIVDTGPGRKGLLRFRQRREYHPEISLWICCEWRLAPAGSYLKGRTWRVKQREAGTWREWGSEDTNFLSENSLYRAVFFTLCIHREAKYRKVNKTWNYFCHKNSWTSAQLAN